MVDLLRKIITCDITRQIGIYIVIGAINTGVDLGSYYIISRCIYHEPDLLNVKILTLILGAISSFYLNRYYTFKAYRSTPVIQLPKFTLVVIVTISVNSTIFRLLITEFSVYDMFSATISLAIAFIVGFVLNKFWVFRVS